MDIDPNITFQKIPFWSKYPELLHGFSTKMAGNLSFRTDSKECVLERRNQLWNQLGINSKEVVILPLTHSNNVVFLESSRDLRCDANGLYQSGGRLVTPNNSFEPIFTKPEWDTGIDALIFRSPNVFPIMLTADCLNIAFYDPEAGVGAVAHVGLIGAVNQLASKVICAMRQYCKSDPKKIEVVMYPSIRKCHYELSRSKVWEEGRESINRCYGHDNPFFTDGFFDLPGFVRKQLIHHGISETNISDTGLCTICRNDLFFSHLNAGSWEQKQKEGRFASVLGWREL